VKTGTKRWLAPRISGEYYIPRIYWTSQPDTLALLILNRKQNQVNLLFFDVNTGGYREVFDEKSNSWIDVYDFYAGVDNLMSFPEKRASFSGSPIATAISSSIGTTTRAS
jgi:dipeptidyl-peptidase-4